MRASSRSGRRSSGGFSYGIRAVRILRLARTSRCAIVGAGTRNARAISSVVRPHSERSESATCASVASPGWQQVQIRRTRSPGTESPRADAAASADYATSVDCAGAGARYTRRDHDRFVEIRRLNYIVAAKLLLRFRERSVGRDGLAVTNSDRGRGAGRFERIAGLEFAGLHDVLRERHVLLMELSVLRRA